MIFIMHWKRKNSLEAFRHLLWIQKDLIPHLKNIFEEREKKHSSEEIEWNEKKNLGRSGQCLKLSYLKTNFMDRIEEIMRASLGNVFFALWERWKMGRDWKFCLCLSSEILIFSFEKLLTSCVSFCHVKKFDFECLHDREKLAEVIRI